MFCVRVIHLSGGKTARFVFSNEEAYAQDLTMERKMG